MPRTGQPVKEITGKKFGHLTVLYRDGHIDQQIAWRVLCDCGKEKRMRGSVIKKKGDLPVTCGCRGLNKEPEISSKLTHFVGFQFNGWKLTNVDYLGNYSVSCAFCGTNDTRTIGEIKGKTNRCKTCRGFAPRNFPQDNPKRFTYGDNYAIFVRWRQMLQRCYNVYDVKYAWYGARGVTVCEEWTCPQGLQNYRNWVVETYPNWKDLFEQRYEIDRIDGSGPYAPWNCRIISKSDNQRNKSIALKAMFRGEERFVVDLAKDYGVVPYTTVVARWKSGFSIDDALFTPANGKRKPPKNRLTVSYLGEDNIILEDLVKEASLLPYGRVASRIHNGWPVEMALILPKRAKLAEAEKYIA